MSVSSILQQCWVLDIELTVKDDNLQVQAPKGILTSDLLALIKLHKQAIIQAITLTSGSAGSSCSTREDEPLDQEAYEERAAIMEYEGELPREEAERLARLCCIQTTGSSTPT